MELPALEVLKAKLGVALGAMAWLTGWCLVKGWTR